MFRSIKRLFGGAQSSRPQADLGLPLPEDNVAIIGDIHGCFDLLVRLLKKLDQSNIDKIIAVGDYVDRGEQSQETLNLLREKVAQDPERFICLKGNHEKMLLDFLDRPVERGSRWIRYGGLQTLASFGVGGVTETADQDSLLAARDAFREALPLGLEDWMRHLPLTWETGNVWVAHAAADPTQPMQIQEERVLLWGHRDFLSAPRQDGIWVAHGHTVTDRPVAEFSRIPTDTGAYFSGRLSAAIVSRSGDVEYLEA